MGETYCGRLFPTIQIPEPAKHPARELTGRRFSIYLEPVKVSLFVLALAVVALSACTTLENRRDMYFPQKVNGPYTRMLKDGIPKPQPVHGAAPSGLSDGKSVVR